MSFPAGAAGFGRAPTANVVVVVRGVVVGVVEVLDPLAPVVDVVLVFPTVVFEQAPRTRPDPAAANPPRNPLLVTDSRPTGLASFACGECESLLGKPRVSQVLANLGEDRLRPVPR
jgi:hypothetical protein